MADRTTRVGDCLRQAVILGLLARMTVDTIVGRSGARFSEMTAHFMPSQLCVRSNA